MNLLKNFGLGYYVDRLGIYIILLIAAIIGLIAVYEIHHSPFSQQPVLDEESYVIWGMSIADGNIIKDKPFYQEALYPYFLGLCFFLFNKSLLAARLVQAGLWVVSVWFMFLTGRKLGGNKLGLLAALLFSLYGLMYLYVAVLLKSALVIFITTIFLYLLVSARAEKLKYWFWIGVVMGLLPNLRGNFLIFTPFVFLWAWLIDRGGVWNFSVDRFKRIALLVVGMVLALLPTTVHNYYVSGEFVATTSQGGANFYIGNHQLANGSMSIPPFVRSSPQWEADDFAAEAERRTGHEMSPSEISRYWFKEGFSFLTNNPYAYAKLLIKKLHLLVNNFEIHDNYSFDFMRNYFMPVLKIPFISFGMLLGMAIVGMFLAWRRNYFSRPLILFAAVYSLSLLMFYVVSRYRVPLVPVVVLFASFYIMVLIDDLRLKKLIRHVGPICIIILMCFLSYLPSDLTKTLKRIAEPQFLKVTGAVLIKQRRYYEAVHYLKLSAQKLVDPHTIYNLGIAYEGIGWTDQAIRAYSYALKLHPNDRFLQNKVQQLQKNNRSGQ